MEKMLNSGSVRARVAISWYPFILDTGHFQIVAIILIILGLEMMIYDTVQLKKTINE